MDERIVWIGCDRGFVPAHRFNGIARFKCEIPEIHHRRRMRGIVRERRFEIGACRDAVSLADAADAALIEGYRIAWFFRRRGIVALFESEAA